MIRAEYLRFLQTLNSDEVPSEVRKLASLVLANLDELVSLGTHQGQRVKRMVALAQANWEALSEEIEPLPVQMAEQSYPIVKIKSMAVGPFRGFAREENFDLESHLVLIYGPNGTGKSSFCEALEYGLLGNVSEAETKRFRDQHDYLKNAYVNRFLAPNIVGLNAQGEEVGIEPNESLYRFCFVEKNRIDGFSRIAAQTPAKQIELISTLFGLDSFNEFVRNFTAEIDARYIDLTGVKKADLDQKRQTLAGANQQKIDQGNELDQISEAEQVLASQYRDGSSFEQVVFELCGDEVSLGVIQKLDDELRNPIANKSNLTVTALQMIFDSIDICVNELTIKEQELVSFSRQVSFQQLYNAVIQVQSSNADHCPACKTPLSQVAVNPYIYASEELQKLQHLALLQKTIEDHQQNISQWLTELQKVLSACIQFLPKNHPLETYPLPLGARLDIEWWNTLHQQLQDGATTWQHLMIQVKHLENRDQKISQIEQSRSVKQMELNRLRNFARDITVLQTRRNTAQQAISKAQQIISNFDAENAQLIAEVLTEGVIVERNQLIVNAYQKFVEMLGGYMDQLPSQLVSDLGDMVVEFYNAFNRYDGEEDKLVSVQLPLSQNQRLHIAFAGNPSKSFDALHVLSEGHIRCIGLAILLAKNIKENCPILVFDDPVNAIDDEHRRAIRETLFVDSFFTNSQVILAIHGEEFFNSTHQLLGREKSLSSESYKFLPGNGENHIQVSSLRRPKNYVVAARELYIQGEYRDALMSARRALENLCEKTWHHYGKYSDKQDDLISVSRRSPSAPWDLRTLAENLKAKLGRSRADIPNKELIIAALTAVVGQNGRSTYWVYLNKGTHDETDLPEFDHHTVNEVVTALENLDSALSVK